MCTVRNASPADAAGIARVQVLTWRVAYEGLIDADYLAGLSIEARTERWARNLSAGPFTSLVLLADGEVIGFSSHGPSRDEDAPPTEGELLALYVAQSHWGLGLGRRLYQASEAALIVAGFTEAILWVLLGNARAERFYRAAGYEHDGATKELSLTEHVVLHHRRMRKSLASQSHGDPERYASCMSSSDATRRFSDRVEDYVKHRPTYPAAVIDWLHDHGVPREAEVADVGSGTGISSGLLLDAGYRVSAVEPNEPMRAAAEARLGGRAGFTSVSGTAEATTLPDRSVDLITVAQAFHWFDPPATRREFRRILRAGGLVVLMWNDRATEASPLMADYEQLLETWGTDFRHTTFRLRPLEQTFATFFEGGFETATFPNAQTLDEAGFLGRLFSSSYTPARDDPGYAPAARAARALFQTHQVGGQIEMIYTTMLYAGRVA